MYADRFWIQVGGKGVWFRVDFHVDLVKWALQRSKNFHVVSIQKHASNNNLVAHNIRWG